MHIYPIDVTPRTGMYRRQFDKTSSGVRRCLQNPPDGHGDPDWVGRATHLCAGFKSAQRRLALLADENLERVVLCRMPEDVVGLQHLVERELMRDELLDRKLVLGHELQQHP
jgi:hypothetical protein